MAYTSVGTEDPLLGKEYRRKNWLLEFVMPSASAKFCCDCGGDRNSPARCFSDTCSCGHKYCKNEALRATRRVKCGHETFGALPIYWTPTVVVLYIFFSLCNNMGDGMMAYRMPCYPEFLLWGTTAGYTLCFALLAVLSGQSFRVSKRDHVQFLWLGLWTSLNGVLAQYALPFVQAELGVLLSQISVPATWAAMVLMVKWRVSVGQLVCFIAIIVGILIGGVPSVVTGNSGGGTVVQNGGVWIIVSIFAALPTALETVFQERVFKDHKCGVWVTLAYYNMYSLLVYMATLPLMMTKEFGHDESFSAVLVNQGHALKCMFGGYDETPYTHNVNQNDCSVSIPDCFTDARLWTVVFTLGYVGMFGTGAMILRVKSSVFEANINAAVTVAGSMLFWSPGLAGLDSQRPVWYVVVSVLVIVVSNLVYTRYAGCDPSEIPNDPIGRRVRGTCWTKMLTGQEPPTIMLTQSA